MNKTLEQFLIQFYYFISVEECRRVVNHNGVRINDYVVKLSDLDKNCEHIKVGDQLKIRNQEGFGYKSFLVKEYHL